MAIGKSNADKAMNKVLLNEILNKNVKHYDNAVQGSDKPSGMTYGTSTDEVASYTVYRTYDYGKFQTMMGNRKVAEKRVITIMNSIKKIGRLPTPIIVNEKMEIIEGQGRYAACKRMGLPIEYIIVVGATVKECREINQSNTPWSEEDYIQSYVESGNENYIRAKILHDEYGFTYVAIFDFAYNYLHCGAVKKLTYIGGGFVLSEETFNFVKKNADILLSFSKFIEVLGARREQVEACIYWLMRYKNIDIDRLKKNIANLQATPHTNAFGKTTLSYFRAVDCHAIKNVENLFHFIVDVYNDGYSAKNQLNSKDLYEEIDNNKLKACYGKRNKMV